MEFQHYEALGNYYLVASTPTPCSPEEIRHFCQFYHSDGMLCGDHSGEIYRLRIFNPDGSEAEKSGNGTRIFARYLWEFGHCCFNPCKIQTLGGEVICRFIAIEDSPEQGDFAAVIDPKNRQVFSRSSWIIHGDLGAYFYGKSPLTLAIGTRQIYGLPIQIGNPHFALEIPPQNVLSLNELGAKIERNAAFPEGTNVEFVKILRDNCISIHIWERGAGFTLSSGTCACAAAIYAHHHCHLPPRITVLMPGGELQVRLENHRGHIQGPVRLKNMAGRFDPGHAT